MSDLEMDSRLIVTEQRARRRDYWHCGLPTQVHKGIDNADIPGEAPNGLCFLASMFLAISLQSPSAAGSTCCGSVVLW